jgi:hypothetical protein
MKIIVLNHQQLLIASIKYKMVLKGADLYIKSFVDFGVLYYRIKDNYSRGTYSQLGPHWQSIGYQNFNLAGIEF